MTQKIKSITIKKDFPSNSFEIHKKIKWEDICYSHIFYKNLLSIISEEQKLNNLKAYSEYFDIEYEKPALLKRPDGSLISKLELDDIVLEISVDYDKIEKNNFGSCYGFSILKGLVFLPEDEKLAEKKAKMLSKQLEIQYEIDRLNAEEGWIPNWNNSDQKWHFKYETDESCGVVYYWNYSKVLPNAMSLKTAKAILAKYPQDELKQYLGIII